MTNLTHRQFDTRRLLALCYAVLYVWMGTAGVTSHTDFLRGGQSQSPSASARHAVPASVAADTCAACQWTQGVQAGTLAAFVCPAPLVTLAPLFVQSPSPFAYQFPLHCSPRAPPVLS